MIWLIKPGSNKLPHFKRLNGEVENCLSNKKKSEYFYSGNKNSTKLRCRAKRSRIRFRPMKVFWWTVRTRCKHCGMNWLRIQLFEIASRLLKAQLPLYISCTPIWHLWSKSIWSDLNWSDLIWFDLILFDTISLQFDLIQLDLIRSGLIQLDLIWCRKLCRNVH